MPQVRVVTPFRPFAPESASHNKLGEFDWIGAISMLRSSVTRYSETETVSITDTDTELDAPSLRYPTKHRRLMLWILEVCLRYIESEDFDRDTVMISPDILVLADVKRWFGDFDFGVLVRPGPRFVERPLLNSVQFWPLHGKKKLAVLYRRALEVATTLSEEEIAWGADTTPFVMLLSPLDVGVVDRVGMKIGMIRSDHVLTSPNISPRKAAASNKLVDFKYLKKHGMRDYYERAFA